MQSQSLQLSVHCDTSLALGHSMLPECTRRRQVNNQKTKPLSDGEPEQRVYLTPFYNKNGISIQCLFIFYYTFLHILEFNLIL